MAGGQQRLRRASRRIRRGRSPARGCAGRPSAPPGRRSRSPGVSSSPARPALDPGGAQVALHGGAGGGARDAEPRRSRRRSCGQSGAGASAFIGRSSAKTEPLPTVAVGGEPPAHRLGQAPADGEAQAGAAEAARGRLVGLGEGLEQAGDLVLAGCRCRCRAPRCAAPPSARGATWTITAPVSVNLMALLTRLPITWRSRVGSASISAGRRRIDVGGEVEALAAGALPEQRQHVLDHLGRVGRARPPAPACRPRSSRSRGCR